MASPKRVRMVLLCLGALLTLPAQLGCKDGKSESSDESESNTKKKKKKKDDDGDDEAKKKKDDDGDDEAKKKKKKDDDGDDEAKKKKKDDDEDEAKKKKKTGDTEDDEPPPKASGGDKLAPSDDDLVKGSEKVVAAFVEGDKHEFKFGKASAGYSGIHVTLSTEKMGCAYEKPSDESYQLDFDLPSGPGGTFYTGHPIGLQLSWNSHRIKLKQTYAAPHLTTIEVEPFKLKEGEHVKGKLRFDARTIVTRADSSKVTYEYKGIGPFDLTLCSDYNNFEKMPPLPPTAPAGPVSGNLAATKFEAKTVLAHVYKDRMNGGEYIESLELYPEADIKCADRYNAWKKMAYLSVRSIGGTGSKQKMSGTQQPADASLTLAPTGGKTYGDTKYFGFSGKRAWVKLDKIDYTAGAKITGELMIASPPDAKPEETGKMGGKFTAVVCSSGF